MLACSLGFLGRFLSWSFEGREPFSHVEHAVSSVVKLD